MLDLIQQWTDYLSNASTFGGWIIAAFAVALTLSAFWKLREVEPDPMSSPWGDVINAAHATRLAGEVGEAGRDFHDPSGVPISHRNGGL